MSFGNDGHTLNLQSGFDLLLVDSLDECAEYSNLEKRWIGGRE